MMGRTLRPIIALVSILLLSGIPAHAGPVALNQVVQVLDHYQNPASIQLRSAYQYSNAISSEVTGTVASQPSNVSFSSSDDTLFSGVTVISGLQPIGVNAPDIGEVDGTICDCGEIPIAGGFPKWPFLFLAAVPLVFINDCDDCDTPGSTPTPTPTPTPPATPTPTPQVPEPGSILLFGSGLAALGAGLRRRRVKAQLKALTEMLEGPQ